LSGLKPKGKIQPRDSLVDRKKSIGDSPHGMARGAEEDKRFGRAQKSSPWPGKATKLIPEFRFRLRQASHRELLDIG
jgi:hypothetical protein